jgi:hypothetical protein
MTVPVSKDIPMPPRVSKGFGGPKYPWTTMEIGDSFEMTAKGSGLSIELRNAAAQARHAGRKYGRTFEVRLMPDGAVRCWRTA